MIPDKFDWSVAISGTNISSLRNHTQLAGALHMLRFWIKQIIFEGSLQPLYTRSLCSH